MVVGWTLLGLAMLFMTDSVDSAETCLRVSGSCKHQSCSPTGVSLSRASPPP